MGIIISQMVNAFNQSQSAKSSGVSTPVYLQGIYDNMRQSLKDIQSFTVGTQGAKRLQYFLNLIKVAQKSYKSSSTTADNFIEELMLDETETALLRKLYEIQPALFSKGGLYSLGSGRSRRGKKLEDDLSRMVSAAQATAEDKSYNYALDLFKGNSIGIGGQHVFSKNYVDDIAKKVNGFIYGQTKDAMEIAAGKVDRKIRTDYDNSASYIHSIQGKVDVAGMHMNLSYSGQLTLEQELISLLNDANFTAKNYASSYDLHLGHTNPYYVFLMVKPAATENDTTAGRWIRMLNCFNNHTDTHGEAPSIFYRIRAIYELTGYGQTYKNGALNDKLGITNNGKFSGANYLVFNPIGTDEIYVAYVGDIVNHLVSQINSLKGVSAEDALFSPIVLPQTYFRS